MRKKVIMLLFVLLLVGCYDNNSKLSNKEQESISIEEKSLSGEKDVLTEYILHNISDKSESTAVMNWRGDYLEVPVLQKIGESIDDFVPEGWELIDSIELDFDNNGLMDRVGVLEIVDFDYLQFDMSEYPRILFALKKLDEVNYVLDFQDINLVKNRSTYGDPYEPLTSDGKSFEINANGRIGRSWSERSKFDYTECEWYLTECETSYGYGFSVNYYQNDDYLKGIGVRSYNSKSFQNIRKKGDDRNLFDLTFDVVLDNPPKLSEVRKNWFLSTDRLGEIVIEEIKFTNNINSDYEEDISTHITELREIMYMDESYIIFRVHLEDKLKEYVALYDRENMAVSVLLEVPFLLGQHSYSFDSISIYRGKIFFSQNTLKQDLSNNSDGSERIDIKVMTVSLNSIGLDGNELKQLFSYENVKIDNDWYPSISMGFEIHSDMIYYHLSRGDVKTYYIMNTNGNQLEILGEVE